MISGEKDMLLIDPQFSLSEAHRLAAEILESKKNRPHLLRLVLGRKIACGIFDET
jgi:hypothetical protein